MLEHFPRVRDVGGSRTRFPDLGFSKHVCGPLVSNADVIRQEKDRGVFQNCGQLGQHCPLRLDIPAAILSHVDYHCTQGELAAIVTGPTFIINHEFHEGVKGLGALTNGFEADVQVNGGRVTMKTGDGVPFEHGYHLWQNEGTVVTATGAFAYVRIGRLDDTCVYYAYPANGVYRFDDAQNLVTADADALPNCLDYTVVRSNVSGTYTFTSRHTAHSFSVPAAVIDEVALTMCTAPRDSKYADTVRSFAFGKLRASGNDLGNADAILRLIHWKSDRMSISSGKQSVVVGNPLDFTWRDRLVCRLRLWIHNVNPTIGDRLESLLSWMPMATRVAPWMFRTVIVPTYEVYTKQVRSTIASGGRKTFNNNRFPAAAAPVNAVSHQHGSGGTSQDLRKRPDIPRDTRFKPSTHPNEMDDSSDDDSGHGPSGDAESSPSSRSSERADSAQPSTSGSERENVRSKGGSEGPGLNDRIPSNPFDCQPELAPGDGAISERPITVEWRRNPTGQFGYSIQSPVLKRRDNIPGLFMDISRANYAAGGEVFLKSQLGHFRLAFVLEELLNRLGPAVEDTEGKHIVCFARFILDSLFERVHVDGGQSPVVKGYGILRNPSNGDPPGPRTVRFRGVDFTIFHVPTNAAAKGKGKSLANGTGKKGRSREEFLKNRDLH